MRLFSHLSTAMDNLTQMLVSEVRRSRCRSAAADISFMRAGFDSVVGPDG